MPNWCSNTTTVYGSVDDLTKFVEAVKCDERSDEVASDLSSFPEARIFDKLLPFPENGHATTPSGVGNVFAFHTRRNQVEWELSTSPRA